MAKKLSIIFSETITKIIMEMADKSKTDETQILIRSIALYYSVKKGIENGEEPVMIKNGNIVAKLVGIDG
jgi:hypothetical protein